ncbi:hypothetical protein A2960_04825 [Candidatus Gottesmanbacteria bacterium RIFCSPLOWO2_01_FULL_39_12b]|uniref:Methyltransferase domain-containing protein n=1 Tax=Candidatus Gottesmanbacteria bacterium RIFCSPLOWO2_01_FULL_39_12b TaxID=1798388 RepID=A0A1F6ANK9_9BACT|nr:MAG: hypothetical protein A2960_04825 [Candidatus Gottesmanbacteria bacterium RIFCSPLOWO2_01_FULL_39_12b]
MSSTNDWDRLSNYFDTSKNDIKSGAADNMMIAWPVILNFIQKYAPRNENIKVLDYGCGGGGFSNKLFSLGFDVTGVDLSSEMIAIAKKNYGEKVKFITGNSNILTSLGKFDIITSIMTLQFIKNVADTIDNFSKVLYKSNLLVFAVFNPAYVVEGIKIKRGFTDFDSDTNPKEGEKLFNDGSIRIPVYIRTAYEYNAIAEKYGFKNVLEEYPEFTREYVNKYPEDRIYKNSEYLILGYRKNKSVLRKRNRL